MESFADLAQAEYLRRRRGRRLKNAAGLLLSAATVAFVYWFGLG